MLYCLLNIVELCDLTFSLFTATACHKESQSPLESKLPCLLPLLQYLIHIFLSVLLECVSLDQLSLIKWVDDQGQTQRFHLHKSISHKWRDIGIFTQLTYSGLENISEKSRGDPEKCCLAVLGNWLENPSDKYPPTWSRLIELLDDCELTQIAEDLRDILVNTK